MSLGKRLTTRGLKNWESGNLISLGERLETRHEIYDIINRQIFFQQKCAVWNSEFSHSAPFMSLGKRLETRSALIWQKEASDKSDIGLVKEQNVSSHLHWRQWNIMLSYLTYLLVGWVFLHEIWPGQKSWLCELWKHQNFLKFWMVCHLLPFAKVGWTVMSWERGNCISLGERLETWQWRSNVLFWQQT